MDYAQASRTFVFDLPALEPGQRADLVAVLHFGGQAPASAFVGLAANGQVPTDLGFTVGTLGSPEHLAGLRVAQQAEPLTAPRVEVVAPSRAGFGQRKVQYILFFCYIGLTGLLAVVWAVWYVLKLFRKSPNALSGNSDSTFDAKLDKKSS